MSGHWDPNLAATDQKNGPSPPPPPPPAPGGFVDATNRHDDPPRHQHVDANDTRTKTPPNNMKMAKKDQKKTESTYKKLTVQHKKLT